jgi:predicted alpha/beta hydrolase
LALVLLCLRFVSSKTAAEIFLPKTYQMYSKTTSIAVRKERLRIPCKDGVELAAVLVSSPFPRAVVQLNSALGIKKEFYLKFAHYLAENGFVALIYDYRGQSESPPQSLRHCTYTYADYVQKDMPAALDYLGERYPGLPKIVIGHSMGGHVGFMPNLHKIDALLCIGVGSGYAARFRWTMRLKSWYFFHLFAPISVMVCGYVASKAARIMEDIPRNTARSWRAICQHPDGIFNPALQEKLLPTARFDQFTCPIAVLWASDDVITTEPNLENYWRHVKSSAGIRFRQFTPSEWGVQRIGHYGFFPSHYREKLWPEVLQEIVQLLGED